MSNVDVITNRQLARQSAELFRGELATGGEEAFWEQIAKQRTDDSVSHDERRANLFGAFAVEYERLAGAELVLPEVPDTLLRAPVGPEDARTFVTAVSKIFETLEPSEGFSKALGNEPKRFREMFAFSSMVEGAMGKDGMATWLTRRGRTTLATEGSKLLPTIKTRLAQEGITDRADIIAGTRSNGVKLLTGMLLSNTLLANFQDATQLYMKEDRICMEIADTFSHFRTQYKVFALMRSKAHPRKDEITLSWKEKPNINVGCPLTLMQEPITAAAWGRVVDLAINAGYYGEPSETAA